MNNLPGRKNGIFLASIYACFFLSGATALVYEIVWMRLLGLVFGHTVYAVTTVLTAFMAGLALGAFLFGRLIDRSGRPLRVYGLLEGGIGIYCLLVPFFLAQAQRLYLFLYQSLSLSFFAFSLAQFALVFLILVVPTTLMGATLPVLSKFFVERLEGIGRKVGDLYALNTFGAVVGSGAAGFFLLPVIGVRLSIILTAALNLMIAAIALLIDRALAQPISLTVEPSSRRREIVSQDETAPMPSSLLILIIFGIALSGAASMVYEIAWTRALVLVIGSSVYAFSAMLTTFLIGLALGSFLFGRIWGRRPIGGSLFGSLELAIALTALALVPAFDRMPDLLFQLMRLAPSSYSAALVSQFSISFLVMILPTTLIGAAFPCVIQIATTHLSRLGREVGAVYSANTLGTVVGAFVAGFFLIPVFGVQSSILAGSALNAVVGAAVLWACGRRAWHQWAPIPLLCLYLIGLAFVPRWDKSVMASGASVYAVRFLNAPDPGGLFRREVSGRKLVFYQEGITSTVSVERTERMTSLRVNGKADASDGIDMLTQLMLGHLPMFLHPKPEKALVIGLGSGVTAGAMAQHPVLKTLDVVELEPAVVQASNFFTHVNRNVLREPRVRVVVADGRNFILASGKKYDVISSEPSNPWMAGVANLFSREFYELARQRLAEDGIMVQWVHGYSLFPRELKMIVNTFRQVFPHVTIWWTIEGDYLLVGTNQRLVVDYARLRERYTASAAVREDFKILGWQSPLALFTLFLLGEEEAARYAQGSPVNTDDKPLLEFSAPLALYADTKEVNHRTLKAARGQGLPPVMGLDETMLWTADQRLKFARALWSRGDGDAALEHLQRMNVSRPGDRAFILEKAKILFAMGRVKEAMQDLSGLSKGSRLVESYLKAGQFFLARGLGGALPHHSRAEGAILDAAEAHSRLGLFYASLGMRMKEPALFDLAVDSFEAALQVEPHSYAVMNSLANTYFEQGRLEEAAEGYRRIIRMKPDLPGIHFNLALVYERKGAVDLAAQEYRTALRLQPGWELPLQNLRKLEASQKSPR